jgi:hypothetical protein
MSTLSDTAEGAADAISALMRSLPKGVEFYGFLIARTDSGEYSAVSLGTCPPGEILPAIKDWVERVEGGDTGVKIPGASVQ